MIFKTISLSLLFLAWMGL